MVETLRSVSILSLLVGLDCPIVKIFRILSCLRKIKYGDGVLILLERVGHRNNNELEYWGPKW